jgi:hypothetical protein
VPPIGWQAQYDELQGWWDHHRDDPINVEPIISRLWQCGR